MLIINDLPNLTQVDRGAFHGLKNLKNLEIKNNPELKSIHKNAFSNSENSVLEYVDFSNNALETLSVTLLKWTEIKEINLNGNNWNCDCQMSWLVTSQFDLICSSPKRLADKPIRDLTPSDFVLTIQKSGFHQRFF